MLIADLEEDLVECMQGYTRGKNPVLADALLAIARPDRFRSILVELLDSCDRLGALAVASQRIRKDRSAVSLVVQAPPSCVGE